VTGLLVSVRDVTEAVAAVRAGVDVLDLKEPSAGPLGAASVEVWEQVVDQVAGEVPVSLALGELLDEAIWDRLAAIPAGVCYAKLGLAGCQNDDLWKSRWQRAISLMPAGVSPVAVIYADHQAARSPERTLVIEAAEEFGCAAVLVDTHDKSAGNLLAHWPLEKLWGHAEQVRQRGMMVVLAGSLDEAAIRLLNKPIVDLLAVRGAACQGERGGRLDEQQVVGLVELVRQQDLARRS
jgi:uncharacterized protein (UPF0264 family)